jgi:hypothetical protein
MDGYLSNKPDNFVDDPKKLYRLRRREAHQATIINHQQPTIFHPFPQRIIVLIE